MFICPEKEQIKNHFFQKIIAQHSSMYMMPSHNTSLVPQYRKAAMPKIEE